MEGLADILGGVFGAVSSGGVFGFLGSIAGAVTKHYQEKQRQAWEQKKWAHETEMHRLNMEQQAAETEQEMMLISQSGAWAGLSASVAADAAIGTADVHKWVNDVLSLFRPFLTLTLIAIGGWWFWSILDLMSGNADQTWLAVVFDETVLRDLVVYMVQSVFFAMSTAIVWWFGDRAMSPPGLKGR